MSEHRKMADPLFILCCCDLQYFRCLVAITWAVCVSVPTRPNTPQDCHQIYKGGKIPSKASPCWCPGQGWRSHPSRPGTGDETAGDHVCVEDARGRGMEVVDTKVEIMNGLCWKVWKTGCSSFWLALSVWPLVWWSHTKIYKIYKK